MKTLKNNLFGIILITLMTVSCTTNERAVEDLNQKNSETTTTRIDRSKYNLWSEVGAIKDGKLVITADKQKMIEAINRNHIEKAGFNPNVENVSIEKMDSNYYLSFTGKEYKVTLYLQLEENSTLFAAAGTSCSTSACSQEQFGCIPQYPNNPAGQSGIGTCTPCANGGGCTKTTSDASLIG